MPSNDQHNQTQHIHNCQRSLLICRSNPKILYKSTTDR